PCAGETPPHPPPPTRSWAGALPSARRAGAHRAGPGSPVRARAQPWRPRPARRTMAPMDARDDPAPGGDRHETPTERLDRNWNEILQELRVTQTGIQILTGFLLTVPFQSRFADLTATQRVVYLVLVLLAAVTTGLMVA